MTASGSLCRFTPTGMIRSTKKFRRRIRKRPIGPAIRRANSCAPGSDLGRAPRVADHERGEPFRDGRWRRRIPSGHPSGIGLGMKPQRFLQPGDTVEVEVEGIGVLRTPSVFVTTSFTSWAPMLAKGLRNWISRAIVTPSSVICGARPVSRALGQEDRPTPDLAVIEVVQSLFEVGQPVGRGVQGDL